MTKPRVRVEPHAATTVLVMSDGLNRNRLDDAMVAELHASLDVADPQHILVIRGEGEGFSAGRPHAPGGHPDGPAAAQHALAELVRLNERIANWPAPVIGVAHGYAHGAALGLLQHCDITLAARGTRFSFPEITYQLPPGLVVSYLQRYIGDKAVRYLVMTGEEVDADRAREMGLISMVVEPAMLDVSVTVLVARLRERLEAEIGLKTMIAGLTPVRSGLKDAMARGLDAVLAWTRRPKTGS